MTWAEFWAGWPWYVVGVLGVRITDAITGKGTVSQAVSSALGMLLLTSLFAALSWLSRRYTIRRR